MSKPTNRPRHANDRKRLRRTGHITRAATAEYHKEGLRKSVRNNIGVKLKK